MGSVPIALGIDTQMVKSNNDFAIPFCDANISQITTTRGENSL